MPYLWHAEYRSVLDAFSTAGPQNSHVTCFNARNVIRTLIVFIIYIVVGVTRQPFAISIMQQMVEKGRLHFYSTSTFRHSNVNINSPIPNVILTYKNNETYYAFLPYSLPYVKLSRYDEFFRQKY